MNRRFIFTIMVITFSRNLQSPMDDSKTVPEQVQKLRERFGLKEVLLISRAGRRLSHPSIRVNT